MLRASLRTSRALGNGSITARAGRQWLGARPDVAPPAAMRAFSDLKDSSPYPSKPPVMPGSASTSKSVPPPPGPVSTSPAAGSSSTIPPSNVPLAPPPPPSKIQTTPPTSTSASPPPPSATTPPPPPPSPPPPVRKPRRILRNLFVTLLFLSVAGFGGGVYYSRVNDNFHDFFTEYVPFGETAVLYFEERDFRKRFPTRVGRPARDTGSQITIPSQSGVSWKVSDDTKQPAQPGAKPTLAAQPIVTNTTEPVPGALEAKHVQKVAEIKKESTPAVIKTLDSTIESTSSAPLPRVTEPSPTPAPAPAPAPKSPAKAPEPVEAPAPKGASRAPEVNEPSRFITSITPIDPISMKNANDPLMQDLAKILNGIITVVNADNANEKFTATISKAKSDLSSFGDKIKSLKDDAAREADEKVKASHVEFDNAAKELVRRLEGEMNEQEARIKDEFEQDRQKLQEIYDKKMKTEVERLTQVHDQRLANELLKQAVELKRKFMKEVKDRVEEERNGRLGRLTDLSNTVNDLEKLTTGWHSIVDANLATQHLHVAVEAVRSSLEKAQTPKPFVRELAALKEIAADDPVVNAAIASINPTAYQRGIPTSAQLIDRFRRVASEVRKASLLPEEAGVASHASSYVLSKILFKKKGLATGDDVESILTRTETLLEEGNLDGAAREMNGLSGWAKTLSKDWLAEVRKVLEVQQALDVIATEARLQSLRVE